MARASSSSTRNLSLTEELEKLEQSITLTLQEIDHNFSRAHQIVTTSILPIVEQYTEHSRAVWEGTKFWKQFFEASANVSLSGYEERVGSDAEGGEDEEDVSHDTTRTSDAQTEDDEYGGDTADLTTTQHTADPDPSIRHDGRIYPDEHSSPLVLESPSMTNSTPRAIGKQPRPSIFAEYPSPYEALKEEHQPSPNPKERAPTTPAVKDSTISQKPRTQMPRRTVKDDPLLHRVLDKTYRIQATPHKTPLALVHHPAYQTSKNDDGPSPFSSPDVPLPPPPQLHLDLFSPRTVKTATRRRQRGRAMSSSSSPPPPTTAAAPPPQTPKPGLSVLHQITPRHTSKRNSWSPSNNNDENSDDDDDEDSENAWEGISPPKTIQFAIPPNQLLRTPARKASKRIVENLLLTAGVAPDDDNTTTTTTEVGKARSENSNNNMTISPTVIRGKNLMDMRTAGGGGGGGVGQGLDEDDTF